MMSHASIDVQFDASDPLSNGNVNRGGNKLSALLPLRITIDLEGTEVARRITGLYCRPKDPQENLFIHISPNS